MLANLREAAAAGLATAASGYLLTDWGDRGHLQPLAASYPALAAGAAFAWHGSDASRREGSEWARAVDRWVLNLPSSGLGAVAQSLSEAYLSTGASQKNGTALFHLVMSPDDGLEHPRYRGLSKPGLERTLAAVGDAVVALGDVDTVNAEARQTRDELLWTADTLRFACDIGRTRLEYPFAGVPESDRRRLSMTLEDLAERRRQLWLERNREGGLEDSLRQFTAFGQLLEV